MPLLLWGSNPSSQDEQSCEYFKKTPSDHDDKDEDYDNIDDDYIHGGDDNDLTEDDSMMIFL